MVFSDLVFTYFFLPAVILIHGLAPTAYRNGILLGASLLFYLWGEPAYVIIMFVSIAVDYTHGLLLKKQRRRWVLLSSILLNLGLLAVFKYTGFVVENLNAWFHLGWPVPEIPLPLGISFFTFQTMSYTIDVYRGEAEPQRRVVPFGTFVTLFPQLVAGPIVRYRDIAAELTQRTLSTERTAYGIGRFVLGMSKKVLLANRIGLLWDTLGPNVSDALGAWLAIIAFGLQIYFDFSGYSDMAIGIGHILGFTFPENFDHPYTARTVAEFWRRWHMTLTGWFRDYVYIPLGGNRCKPWRHALNIMIVWSLTGIWHGASWNFMFWGIYFGLCLLMERFIFRGKLAKLPPLLGHLYTLFFVAIGWVLFACEELPQLTAYLALCFGAGGLAGPESLYYLVCYLPLLIILFIGSTPLVKTLWLRLPEKVRAVAAPVAVALGLILCTAAMVDATYDPFLYFRF